MSRRLGQHFLADRAAARGIVAAAGIDKSDYVAEIGPGKGALTGLLAEAAGEVAAVELDAELCELLETKFRRRRNVRVLRGNFLEADPESLFSRRRGRIKVVGNIPYYITSPILKKLFGMRERVGRVVLTVQKEVAVRMCSEPGTKSYGALSVFTALNAEASIVFYIGRESFSPPPAVDSAVVRLDVRGAPPVPADKCEDFSRFVKSMFAQKRKMVHNALESAAGMARPQAVRLLDEAGVDGTLRPERIPAERYIFLFEKLTEVKCGNQQEHGGKNRPAFPARTVRRGKG